MSLWYCKMLLTLNRITEVAVTCIILYRYTVYNYCDKRQVLCIGSMVLPFKPIMVPHSHNFSLEEVTLSIIPQNSICLSVTKLIIKLKLFFYLLYLANCFHFKN